MLADGRKRRPAQAARMSSSDGDALPIGGKVGLSRYAFDRSNSWRFGYKLEAGVESLGNCGGNAEQRLQVRGCIDTEYGLFRVLRSKNGLTEANVLLDSRCEKQRKSIEQPNVSLLQLNECRCETKGEWGIGKFPVQAFLQDRCRLVARVLSGV